MRKVLNLSPWEKDNDVHIARFRIVKENDEFASVFHRDMHFFSDCLLRGFVEVKDKLGKNFEKYSSLRADGIVLMTKQDEDNIFEINYWQKLTDKEKILSTLEAIDIKVELVSD